MDHVAAEVFTAHMYACVRACVRIVNDYARVRSAGAFVFFGGFLQVDFWRVDWNRDFLPLIFYFFGVPW